MLAGLLGAFDWRPRGSIALANELAGKNERGITTLQIDTAATVPVTNTYIGAGKNLIYQIGTNSSATLRTGMVCAGGVTATKANFPLGISQDAPYQAGDFFDVEILGAIPGTTVGISAGAITDLDWVGSGANGLVISLATIANGSYWCIGKATKTVTGIGQEISFVPCIPFVMSVTNGAPSTYAQGAPL
jgi:hypothetical protein